MEGGKMAGKKVDQEVWKGERKEKGRNGRREMLRLGEREISRRKGQDWNEERWEEEAKKVREGRREEASK